MKLVFASDSFKGSLSSEKTAELLKKAAHEVFGGCECVCITTADGGEGTVDAVIAALGGKKISAAVHDPLMNMIHAVYGVCGDTAVIEMAAASGLTLVPESLRDPTETTTFGTGELVLDALDRGCRRIFLAIGGSATNDGGMGCLRALGARFLDHSKRELSGCGKDLVKVSAIDLDGLDKRLLDTRITALCDVKNPLCGPNGATYTFAAQKGADAKMLDLLESGMKNYRDVIYQQFGVDCDRIEGAGAAGGLGAALKVFFNAEMRSGIDTVLDLIGFDEKLAGADLVVTGEGRADRQSCFGKVMRGVAQRAKNRGVPAVGLCGSLGEGANDLLSYGITELICVTDSTVSLPKAMENAEQYYYDAAIGMFRRYKDVMI